MSILYAKYCNVYVCIPYVHGLLANIVTAVSVKSAFTRHYRAVILWALRRIISTRFITVERKNSKIYRQANSQHRYSLKTSVVVICVRVR